MSRFASYELANGKAVTVDLGQVIAWSDASNSAGEKTILYLSSGAELSVKADMTAIGKQIKVIQGT
jgi:hypothetical protein